ncbi:PAS domain S-box-containing protein [Granulicella aggregans]|uniref:histidine kinase n=1 Tax=Granulicella aggregans TaxID=474949 RepID=A0A7W7ZD68_9BACT|nr:sensor histidine kinase [Granulicella aggregans]MBB5057652.1 PAS domain S-box-containing protein [Granulicella aggregans]
MSAFLCTLPLGVYLRSNTLQPLLSSEYSPRRALYLAHPGLLWTNVISDSLIAISYVLFFFGIRWLVGKLNHIETMRSNLWALSAFNVFIMSCGAMILLRIITIWYPLAQISLALKIICAAASLPPALIFVWRAPAIASGISRFFDLLDSEHRHAEALRKSEAFLDQTNRVAGIGGWELDLATSDLTWSAESARMHGLPPGYKPLLEEAINYFGRSYHPTIRAALQDVIDGGPGWDLELPLYRVDGRKLWVRLIGEPEIVDGRPVRVFGSVQDKTEEVEQREALRRSQAFLDRTNKVAGIGGWEFDIATKDLVWSDQTARIHGRPAGYKPTYEESFTYFPAEYHPYIQREVDAAFAIGGTYDLELPLIRPDGQRVWIRLIGEVQLRNGIPARIFGSLQDKTLEVEQREVLRKSQNFLDRTNRIAGVGGWEIDIPTGVVTWSAETYRIHALPLTYKPSLEAGLTFYAENARPIITAAVQRAFDTGEGWDLETEFIRADDKHIWVRTVGNVEIVDGKPQRLIGAIQDKTAQVNARMELQRLNERITLATDGGEIGIWDWDVLTNRFICDAWMFRIHGLKYVEGSTDLSLWTRGLHPDDRPLTVAALLDALEGNSEYSTEFRVVWDDGSTHIVQASGKVFRDAKGHATRMIGLNRDVTEAHRLANELQQQHELLSVTLFSIGDAVVSVDAQRNIVWMNGAAERMTGWDATEAIDRPVSEVFTILFENSRLPASVHVDPNIARSRRICMEERAILVARDATEFGVETCATPIYDSRAELAGSVLVVRDITEQLRHAREIEQINKLQLDLKLKDQFLSHVSHELRSPLTSVYSFTSIIADNLAGDTTDEQQQYLQIVLKNVLQLQAMIEDLLTVTQSKEGKFPIEAEDFAVAPAIRDAVHTSHPASSAKQISVDDHGVREDHCAWTDPTRLRQIMIILLDNAIKFTPPGGHVFIRTYDEGRMLRIEVEDDGCGIPLDKRARVFEKLYQIVGPGHADTSLEGRIGLGLGLHIARDLVRRQGGNIWVTGAPEQGSIFNFTLPSASVKQEDGTPSRRETDWATPGDSQLTPAA